MSAPTMLVAGDKGLLAIDESISTCNKRFGRLGITQDEPTRRDYRELIITTPGSAHPISGVILYDETIRQHTSDGVPFLSVLAEAGIIAGIRVDCARNGRPIQQPALTIWDGQQANVARAQQALRQRATSNRAARRGEYPSIETGEALITITDLGRSSQAAPPPEQADT